MQARTQDLMGFFQSHGGVARFSAILKFGFHPDSLRALEKEGKVEKIARGLYRISNYTPGSHPDLVIASLQAPKGVICLLSALSFYEATNEIPKYVDLAIPQGTHANRIKYPQSNFTALRPKHGKQVLKNMKLKVTRSKFIALRRRLPIVLNSVIE